VCVKMSAYEGIDLCPYAAAVPPEGMASNFEDPVSLAPEIIAICAVMMAAAVVFTGGRLYANFRLGKLTWSDCEFSTEFDGWIGLVLLLTRRNYLQILRSRQSSSPWPREGSCSPVRTCV